MEMMYDLCIVGAGMFGSASARYASLLSDLKIVLIGPKEPERKDFDKSTVFGCHYDEGRNTTTISESWLYNELTKSTLESLRNLEDLSGIRFLEPVGFLTVGHKDSPYLEDIYKVIECEPAPPHTRLTPSELSTRFPYLKFNPNDVGILDKNGAGYISARKIVDAQKRVASQQNCTIINDIVIKITQFSDAENYHEVSTSNHGNIASRRVLICTGSFTTLMPLIPELLDRTLSCNISRETVVLLKITEKQAKCLSSMPAIDYYPSHHSVDIGAYIFPPIMYPDGCYYMKIGHIGEFGRDIESLQEAQEWYCSEGNPDVIHRYTQLLKDVIPGLVVEEVKSATCACCYTPTNFPYIDNISATVTVAFAGNGIGARICDEVGRLAAELSLTGKWDSKIPKEFFKIHWKELKRD